MVLAPFWPHFYLVYLGNGKPYKKCIDILQTGNFQMNSMEKKYIQIQLLKSKHVFMLVNCGFLWSVLSGKPPEIGQFCLKKTQDSKFLSKSNSK